MEGSILRNASVGKKIRCNLYLPPEYDTSGKAYPVLYRIYSSEQSESLLQSMAEEMNSLINTGKMITMIVVNFRADEAVSIKELVAGIDRNYRTIAAYHGRAVEGFFDAGAGALTMAMKYPDLFSSVISYNGTASGDGDKLVGALKHAEGNQDLIRGKLRIFLMLGKDQSTDFSDNFHRELDNLRIPHKYETLNEVQGESTAYSALQLRGLRFHSEELQFAKAEDLAKPGKNTILHSNLKYAEADGNTMLLDLYLPRNAATSVPLLIWIHGGGWMCHSKEYYAPVVMVDKGYAVASINYRLTHQAIFPAQLEDCKAAVRWLRAHAAEYGLDGDRFGVWGNSAGGHLSALVGTTGSNCKFDVGENLEYSSAVQAVCDYYGPVDFLQMHHPDLKVDHRGPSSAEARLLGGSSQEHPELAVRANPITYISPDTPPFLIMHGDNDEVVHYTQSFLLYDALREAGLEAEIHILDKAVHGFEVTDVDVSPVNNTVAAFFDKHLKKQILGKRMGPLRVSTPNSGYFENFSDGRPVYLTGTHTWNNFQDTGELSAPFDYTAYIDFLREHGMNFIRLWAWENPRWGPWASDDEFRFDPVPYARTGPGIAKDGLPRFNLNEWNEAYFDRMAERVRLAMEAGIYVGIMLFSGCSIGNKDWPANDPSTGQPVKNPWDSHPFHRDNNVNGMDGDRDNDGQGWDLHRTAHQDILELQKVLIRKVIDTVNQYDNVLYEIANEDPFDSWEWQYEMISCIKEYEASKFMQHPVGMTASWKQPNEKMFDSPADWISPYYNEDEAINPLTAFGDKVWLADTDHVFPNMGATMDFTWKAFLRGANIISMDNKKVGEAWKYFVKKAGGNIEKYELYREESLSVGVFEATIGDLSQKYTRVYANRLELKKVKPSSGLSSTGYCLADPGNEYLVYQPDDGSFTVDLSATAVTLMAEWFNPVTGEKSRCARMPGGSRMQEFIPPFAPAVLYLKAEKRFKRWALVD